MAVASLVPGHVAWVQVPPPPAPIAAGGWGIPTEGGGWGIPGQGGWAIPAERVEPARWVLKAHPALRGVSELYLWFVALLAVWALAPAAVGMTPVLITSGSMRPHVSAGDVVVIHDGVDHPVETGSVITFRDPAGSGRLITHRVTDRNADGSYETRGDANAAPDSTPVPPDHVVGVGRLLVPAGGLPALWLRTGEPGLFALWAAVTAAALAGALAPTPRSGRRRRQPGAPAHRPAWVAAAVMSLSTVTVLSLAALSGAVFSGASATSGDWAGATLPVPQNPDASVTCCRATL